MGSGLKSRALTTSGRVTFVIEADEHETANDAAMMEYVTRKGEEPEPHVAAHPVAARPDDATNTSEPIFR